jgi:hypothetical protein
MFAENLTIRLRSIPSTVVRHALLDEAAHLGLETGNIEALDAGSDKPRREPSFNRFKPQYGVCQRFGGLRREENACRRFGLSPIFGGTPDHCL